MCTAFKNWKDNIYSFCKTFSTQNDRPLMVYTCRGEQTFFSFSTVPTRFRSPMFVYEVYYSSYWRCSFYLCTVTLNENLSVYCFSSSTTQTLDNYLTNKFSEVPKDNNYMNMKILLLRHCAYIYFYYKYIINYYYCVLYGMWISYVCICYMFIYIFLFFSKNLTHDKNNNNNFYIFFHYIQLLYQWTMKVIEIYKNY